MNDSILRCHIPVLLQGFVATQVLDTIENESGRCVVLEWGEGAQGLTPKMFVELPHSAFAVAANNGPFELTCETIIDLDHSNITDLPSSGLACYMPPPD